eukprot:jgi/Bigna1/145567/aug1.100_g20275
MAEEKQLTAKAWAVEDGKLGMLTQKDVSLPPLKPQDVEVKIICSGVCSSDLAAVHGKFPKAAYPFPIFPGHEGVGVVTEVGSEVKHVAKGDRVGLGVYRYGGKLIFEKNIGFVLMYMLNNVGSFSTHCRISSQYAFKIPDSIESEHAGPLMCAGLTTFAPFIEHDIEPGSKIGIVGIGGLGHLSIQFASKWGCEVFALSGSKHKEDSVKKLGAHHFVNTRIDGALKKLTGKLDYIMMTASGPKVDWAGMINALAPGGKLILMGINAPTPVPIPLLSLILGQRAIVGSAAGSSGVATKMLKFAAFHGIKPMVEKFPFKEINEVIKKVAAGKVMYRAVCVHEGNDSQAVEADEKNDS